MSRAFMKNDASNDREFVPRRAPLPPGIPNYVTLRGISLLRRELAFLEAQRAHVHLNTERDDFEPEYQLAFLTQRIKELTGRIERAKVVDIPAQQLDRASFGVTITVQTITGSNPEAKRRLTIVGVDEADPSKGLVSFLAPIAKAVIGRRVGDIVTLYTVRGKEVLEIMNISTGESQTSSGMGAHELERSLELETNQKGRME